MQEDWNGWTDDWYDDCNAGADLCCLTPSPTATRNRYDMISEEEESVVQGESSELTEEVKKFNKDILKGIRAPRATEAKTSVRKIKREAAREAASQRSSSHEIELREGATAPPLAPSG